MAIIAGAYFGYYGTYAVDNAGSLALGNTRTGFRHSHNYSSRAINFDALGEAPADVLMLGWTVTVDFVLQEYDAAAIEDLQWSQVATNSVDPLGETDQAGIALWERAKPLYLRSCTNTNPCVRVYPKAILAPNFNIDVDFAHTERAVALRMLILPIARPVGAFDYDDYAAINAPSRPVGCANLVYWLDGPCA